MSADVRQSPEILDHVVHLFYETDRLAWADDAGPVAPDLHSLGDLTAQCNGAGCWLLPPWAEALQGPAYAAIPLWTQGQARLSRDLVPSVRDLLSGKDGTRGLCYGLSASGSGPLKQLFSGSGLSVHKEGLRPKYTLALDLAKSPRSAARLARFANASDVTRIRLKILPPTLRCFRSGVAILDLPVEVQRWDRQPLPLAVLVEAVKALARNNRLHWVSPDGQPEGTGFSLGAIARSLLEGKDASQDPDRRVISCTYVQLDQRSTDEDLRRAAFVLANHFTDDYELGADLPAALPAAVRNIEKVAAAEGSCIAVRLPDDPPDALKQYRTGAFDAVYAPLALLAVHEQAALKKLAAQATIWPLPDEAGVRHLEAISARADAIRLAFVFARVSLLGPHETWRESLESAMRLPTLRARLSDDLNAVHGAIRTAHEQRRTRDRERRQQRFAVFEACGGGGLAAVSIFSVLKDVLAPSFVTQGSAGQLAAHAISLPWTPLQLATAPLVAAAISLAAGIGCGSWLYYRARSLAADD